MAQTIKLKRSNTSGATPTTSQLELGEVAINTYDGKMYIKKNDGTEAVVEIGDHASAGYYAASNPNGYTSNVGDITAVAAGSGLSGGGTSGTVTVNVGAGDGIDTAVNTVAVDSTVIRTTGNQTLGGIKTFSSEIVANAGVDVSGNVVLTGTVDGRDVAADGTKLDGIEANATADQTALEILTAIQTEDGSGSFLDADMVDNYHADRFFRRQGKANATVGGGWMTVATCTSGRHHGEVIVTDGNASYPAFIRIDWMRSYDESSFSVINCGGHANRITGARVLEETSFPWSLFGIKLLQVYVTASSNYEVNIYELGDIDNFTNLTVVTPVIENTKTGYAVQGNELTGLDAVSLAAEEGIKAGGVVTATGGNSTNWNTAYGWGNHASQSYATQSYVGTQISNLVDSSPAALDTLNELAAALGDDPNFATTVSTSIGTKWAQDNTKISNWDTAYGWGDHSTEGYLTSYTDTNTTYSAGTGISLSGTTFSLTDTNAKLSLAGGTMTGSIALSQNPVGTTYGNGVSTVPTDMISQVVGDNDGWRLYGESPASNDVKVIFEVVDDIETGDTWVFRNKKTYSPFTATEPFKIGGLGDVTALGTVTATGGNSTNWNTAYGWGNHASAGYITGNQTITLTGDVTGSGTTSITTTAAVPSAPSITATSVVGETIEVTFSQSSTSGVDHYEVWSDGGSSTDYSLVARVPEEDIASSMSIVDSSFDAGGTIAYRAYAVKNGVYSTAATASRAYTVSTSLDVSSLSVVPDTNVYHINYNKPASRFIDHIEIYKDAEAVQGNLSRTGAALVYSGANSAFTYSIGASDLDKYHQFWVEVVAV